MEQTKLQIDATQYRDKPYVIYYLMDVHEGAANMDEKALARAVKMIKHDGDAWLGNGDYIDAITITDPRFNAYEIADKYSVRDLSDLPKKQTESFMESINDIYDKCLGFTYGNHEDSYIKHNSFDVVNHMCQELDITNLRHKGWISLSFESGNKSIPIKIVMCHGAGGGGMREGAPINKCYDVFRWDVADVHVMGHVHQMQTDRAIYNRLEYGVVRQDPSWFCVGGTFLRKSSPGNDGYFEQRPGKESSIGLLKQTIYTNGSTKTGFGINMEKIYL